MKISKCCSFLGWVPHPFRNGVFTFLKLLSMRSVNENKDLRMESYGAVVLKKSIIRKADCLRK